MPWLKVKNRMFSHGTLMLNSDLDEVQNALKVNPAKIKSKVLNLFVNMSSKHSKFLNGPLEIEEFKKSSENYLWRN